MRLFFSWQSNIPENKKLLSDILQKICEELDIEYTEDTRGEAGGEHVVDVLLRKIKNSDIFVGDITIVGQSVNKKSLSNSNVTYELGYAEYKLGRSKIIMIMNEEYGSYNNMPFDLGKRMITRYKTKANKITKEDRANLYKELKDKIKSLTNETEITLTEDLDEYEKTILFWGQHYGSGFIRYGFRQQIDASLGNRALCVGVSSFLYSGAERYFYREYNVSEATFFRQAVSKLVTKGYLLKVKRDDAFPSVEEESWLISQEGDAVASTLSESEVKPLIIDEEETEDE